MFLKLKASIRESKAQLGQRRQLDVVFVPTSKPGDSHPEILERFNRNPRPLAGISEQPERIEKVPPN